MKLTWSITDGWTSASILSSINLGGTDNFYIAALSWGGTRIYVVINCSQISEKKKSVLMIISFVIQVIQNVFNSLVCCRKKKIFLHKQCTFMHIPYTQHENYSK